ncbi:phosphorylase b kinase gamma catalytic chain, skeletal muscle/heart isoform-like [Saccoglossus kowalevskii]|uniref:phosphorylase kinase n=1 Tax=Saccoglossus kowalevskii TaxID=10224 RepID=A0ABM0MJD6_SACKO|nr:PREDICTED: phosphorylase b kinase gamma catalytic chain, liver/testis isoform-like [Saccoglossus kowalevskii]
MSEMTIGDGFNESDDELPDLAFASEFYAKYEPKEVLGRGISSVVRRCIHKDTGYEYAVKIIDICNERGSDEEVEALDEATRNEVKILQKVAGHPNIIGFVDFYESPAFLFLIFELCKQGELFDYLTSVVTLSEKKTRQIMKQVLEAVEYFHDMNIVHRDLKPENILLDEYMDVKITDFGFSVQLEPGELLTDLCGTPGYLSPETLRCNMNMGVDGYSKEVDLWACGVIMYTLLVGSPPFWHRRQMVMLRAIMDGRYQFGSPEWDDISDLAKDLISKLLVVNPKTRLTANQALQHPYFSRGEAQIVTSFVPLRKFKAAIHIVRSIYRLQHWTGHRPISLKEVQKDPYRIKDIRKAIDACAFKIYAHWVKKGEDQNRAALFENTPKVDQKRGVAQRRNRFRRCSPSPSSSTSTSSDVFTY